MISWKPLVWAASCLVMSGACDSDSEVGRPLATALNGKNAPVIDGFSGDQRFFLGWAQLWRQLRRDQSLRNLLLSDPHSPSALRVDGVVRNLDAFYEAFDVHEGAALWLPPEQRVHIW